MHASVPGHIQPSDLDGTNGFRLDGVGRDLSGHSVAGAGDVNGDGFADILVGARVPTAAMPMPGETYVVFGKASDFAATFDLATLNGNNGFRLDGIDAVIRAAAVSSAGDVNGDGFDDS